MRQPKLASRRAGRRAAAPRRAPAAASASPRCRPDLAPRTAEDAYAHPGRIRRAARASSGRHRRLQDRALVGRDAALRRRGRAAGRRDARIARCAARRPACGPPDYVRLIVEFEIAVQHGGRPAGGRCALHARAHRRIRRRRDAGDRDRRRPQRGLLAARAPPARAHRRQRLERGRGAGRAAGRAGERSIWARCAASRPSTESRSARASAPPRSAIRSMRWPGSPTTSRRKAAASCSAT